MWMHECPVTLRARQVCRSKAAAFLGRGGGLRLGLRRSRMYGPSSRARGVRDLLDRLICSRNR